MLVENREININFSLQQRSYANNDKIFSSNFALVIKIQINTAGFKVHMFTSFRHIFEIREYIWHLKSEQN